MAILTSGCSQFKNSHWYTREGEPAHRMPKASGEGDRSTTIRDAERLGLLPSVTNILGVIAKPALERWKVEQALYAADKNPRGDVEPVEYWVKRVQDASWQQVEDAADLGSKVHHALDAAFDGQAVAPEMQAYAQPVLDWLSAKKLQITHRENRVVSLVHGYAGTTDVLFTWGKNGRGILDYKTKKTEPGKKVESYLEHKAQLSAYAAAFYGEDALDDVLAANLFISTTEPGRLEVVKHESVREHYEVFLAMCQVWRVVKGYDPRSPAPAGK